MTPFLKMLRTTLCPSDEEIVEIRNIVSHDTQHLKRLDREIAHAQETLDRLLQQRKTTQISQEAHRSLLSPIRRLPTDVLTEIFMHCLPDEKFIVPMRLYAPLILGQICAGWRYLSLAMPRLWSSIEVNYAGLETFELWLSRSGNCSLSISLKGGAMGQDALLDLVIANSMRWKHVRFDQPPDFILEQGSIPLLESFELSTYQDFQDGMFPALRTAPCLREVIYFQKSYPVRMPHLQLELPLGLTRLEIGGYVDVFVILDTLEQCPSLTSCDLGSISEPEHNLPSHRDVVHLQLRSLTVTNSNLAYLFEHLVVPNLHSIECSYSDSAAASLPSLLRRSSCPLEILSIFFSIDRGDDITECLTLVNNTLTELTIQCTYGSSRTYFPNNFYESLTVGISSTPLCPRLEIINLYNCFSDSEESFVDMIESRWKGPTCPATAVARIKVVETTLFKGNAMSRLIQMRNRGLILKVYRPYSVIRIPEHELELELEDTL